MRLSEIFNMYPSVIYEVLHRYWEYGCETTVTDEDMLKLLIDEALKNGDREKFMKLTEKLKEMKANVNRNVGRSRNKL